MVTASYSYILHLLQGIHTYISLTIVLFLQSQLTGVTYIVHNYYGSFVFTMGLSYRTTFICRCFITVLWLQCSMSWKLCSIIFVHFLAVLYNNIHLKTNPLCPTLQGHRIIMLLKLATLLKKFRRFRWLVMRTLISRNQYPVWPVMTQQRIYRSHIKFMTITFNINRAGHDLRLQSVRRNKNFRVTNWYLVEKN